MRTTEEKEEDKCLQTIWICSMIRNGSDRRGRAEKVVPLHIKSDIMSTTYFFELARFFRA